MIFYLRISDTYYRLSRSGTARGPDPWYNQIGPAKWGGGLVILFYSLKVIL